MSATPKATSEKSVHFHTSTVSAPAQKAEKTRTPTPTLSEKRAVFQRLRRLARETRAARPEKSTPQLLDLEETLRSAPASHTEIKREPGDKVQAPPPLNLLPVKRELGVDDFSEPQLLLTPVKEEPSETEPTQKRARTGPPTAAEDEPGAYELPRGVATTPENLVLTARLNRSINLHMITMKLLHHGAEYNPRRFCAMVLKWHMNASTSVPTTVEEQEIGEIHMHLRKLIKVSVLVFHAGKMVCTGAKNMAEAYRVLNMVTELIRSVVGSDIRLEDYTLENVVCSAMLPFYIDLTRLAAILPAITTYNPGPKGFPGAILSVRSVPSRMRCDARANKNKNADKQTVLAQALIQLFSCADIDLLEGKKIEKKP